MEVVLGRTEVLMDIVFGMSELIVLSTVKGVTNIRTRDHMITGLSKERKHIEIFKHSEIAIPTSCIDKPVPSHIVIQIQLKNGESGLSALLEVILALTESLFAGRPPESAAVTYFFYKPHQLIPDIMERRGSARMDDWFYVGYIDWKACVRRRGGRGIELWNT
ncbi:hypothetical protein GQ43DRAFT_434377 [Delitschia confertaspora ATCC 74209]|uniref:Uncharacterized protein n=1 Tax=Delitschia confertaspora ATCC 74209 TaxID=1513339 RepID=A0A9P4JF84_9PLEO|nr:hypothetical protein GQ43DRAFT_434377 [Delitschia confertaspora ATCC 74209]